MNKTVCRNFYYVKESILEFFSANKKYLFFAILSVVTGLVVGFCVGVKNIDCYTIINVSDKIICRFLETEKFWNLFFKLIFKNLFLVVLILVINNFSFLSFLNYCLFAYLSFRLALDTSILCSLLGFAGTLWALLCYFLFSLAVLFLLITIFLVCKSSNDLCGCSSGFLCYPIKSIVLIYVLLALFCLILSISSKICLNFVG